MNSVTEFYRTLSNDLQKLIVDVNESKIVNIKVGKHPHVENFRAHSNILMVRSPYFKDKLSTQAIIDSVDENNMIVDIIQEIDAESFPVILRYIYTGVADLSTLDAQGLLNMLIGVNILQLEELSYHLQDYLINKYSNWIQQNYVQILSKISKNQENFAKISFYCFEKIGENPISLFSLKDFTKLNDDIFYIILDQETLQCDEVIVWEALIKWSIDQSPNIKEKSNNDDIFNTSNWNDEIFDKLKNIVDKFIPCIHFFEISSSDFYGKIRPYRKILSPETYEEILAYHMKETKRKSTKLWPRLGKIDSEIIKSKQATSITNLIGNHYSLQNKKKISFSLLYRANRDGFNPGIFRNQCNDQGSSLALIKLDNGKVIGGYNPLGWMKIDPKDKNDYSKSFLFSFDPNLDIRSMKCISVKTPIFAFNNQNQQALHFGTSDLIINGKTGTCIVKDFQNPIINTRNFNIDNIEVFAVRMK
ncbi:uncharacterized protein OCT59_005948 [Rhizophagus irregularis]|uniref:Serine-enriched protein n=2 Tax=Rhizophagus irregularis TaxID=588596 RepID=A0A015JTA2_RHIIW|nr:hypothetical protein GLOIN_2v1768256 [Rhizophagus irregularis DAOM 181602=DAOM 197198]EXX70550.1 hypothetical protein RirG_086420 [Rhizophagus irregularis DAOM 197198w]POG77001.1 hypothetical protein GLOIN_2v1768256 [Rhizophagus irregularis DAOM 181602=DAOM 197198]UZO14491.1 hypothetical protein OCT59_005948 [Rhizophagus irregularis]GBC38200.1 hypothetical protein GLOIN_2v1768256 [Rhizophagus irregularis DAOM 181602=DAOM 197198]|eukprot:XP_025183867.1 hypothetical protein GLOIN_2v1768256 [Rhizophagus irregularis DAOM 181602=DAOM 197198]